MFGGKQANPYDEIVTKTTDENLTSENWELILNLCDKVNDEGEQGARSVIAAVLKRLTHRNPNVQLYALALAEALSKNCGAELHREMASRSFTQGLEKLVTDRMAHEKVKRRALFLISLWTGEFENNSQLGLMEELYNNLKSKNFKFEQVEEPPPPSVDDEVRRKEEEELQRVLEMSVHDKGGRNFPWTPAGLNATESGGSRATVYSGTSLPGPSSSGGYTPVEPPRSAYPVSDTHHQTSLPATQPQKSPTVTASESTPPSNLPPEQSSSSDQPTISNNIARVRALHTFEPTVAGELAFEKGDIIKVTDRAYDNWWRGQLRGRTGIFPVNYVEPLPDLTPGELAREAEQEAAVFAQAANIDKLIHMLRTLDPAKDNLADNEEIQELYRSSMSLRPKIVKLIDKYSQKRAELVAMNENFVKARGVFEQMMEDSLARHTGVYDNPQPTFRKPRPDSRPNVTDYRASVYGWNAGYEQPGYNAYPASPAAYGGEQHPHQPQNPYQGQPYVDPSAYSGLHQPNVYAGTTPQGPQPYPPVDPSGYVPPQQQATVRQASPLGQQPQSYNHAPTLADPAYPQQNPQAQPTQSLPQPQLQAQAQPQAQAHPQPHPQPQPQPQPRPQPQPQAQPHSQSQPQLQSQPHPQPQPQPQPQQVQPSSQQQGPPFVYDPNTQYADPNVQAWAQYYAQGGTDPTGAVYFISIPGVTDVPVKTSNLSVAGQTASQSQNPASTSPGTTNLQRRNSQPAPSTTAQVHSVQAQGPPSTAYQGYGSTTDPITLSAEHLQSQVQPPNGTTTQADPTNLITSALHATSLGAPGGAASQSNGPSGYPSEAPMQHDARPPPVHDVATSYQSYGQPAEDAQQA